ncbi:Coatomer subunit zeta-2 [Zea mays]|uniref:Coatomer subunit zeta-2 n=1 Tax=Zea mays TaxID=4577 RepID=A0A1D6I677_MAIZE|nr:Coatomer subunit zeta-2 [Zea mays]ONM55595.1 Coatomer subunit zeta-2 [Zea mays]
MKLWMGESSWKQMQTPLLVRLQPMLLMVLCPFLSRRYLRH